MFGRQPIESINVRTAFNRFFTGEIVLVDVRSDAEYEEVRVARSVHIPVREVGKRIDELRSDLPVAFICRSGHRSTMAARTAAKQREDVLNVDGGMNAWLDAGLPAARCPVSKPHSQRTDIP